MSFFSIAKSEIEKAGVRVWKTPGNVISFGEFQELVYAKCRLVVLGNNCEIRVTPLNFFGNLHEFRFQH